MSAEVQTPAKLICDCPRVSHEHGTRVMYVVHKCRCGDCRRANTEATRVSRRAKLFGRHHLTDAEPVREHVTSLMAQGMGWKRIARSAGLPTSSVEPIIYGRGGIDPRPPRKQISKAMAAKLLAVEFVPAPSALVDGLITRRKLRALVAIGWPQSRIADGIGISGSNIGKIVHGDHPVLQSTAEAAAQLFDEHWDRPPGGAPASSIARARNYAKRHGWVTAAAWDDIDDPTEEPKADLRDETIDHRAVGFLEKVDRLELLIAEGYGDDDATFVRAGWSSRMSALPVLERKGRTDLIEQLRRNVLVSQVAS